MGIAYLCVSCNGRSGTNVDDTWPVATDTIEEIVFYKPNFDKIEYYTNSTPSENDTSIIFCCTASFTKHRLFTYNSDNVSGPYVSTDRGYCKGYEAIDSPIAFVYENNQWRFQRDSIESHMKSCSERGGIAFAQMNISLSDSVVPRKTVASSRIRLKRHRYRALCERNDTLFIAESLKPSDYKNFVSSLRTSGIQNAIYLDCGLGWSYGWYRINSNSVKLLHWFKPPYISNWLVFKRY